jgi:transposase
MASVMPGIEGVMVTEAEWEAGGRLPVWAKVTASASCPECGTVSEKVHQYVVTAPRDARICGEDADFFLVRRRMACLVSSCSTGTFTEWVPQLPPRCPITRRLLEHAGAEVAERGITPAEAARHNRISWPSAHGAFTEKADEILGEEIAPVAHLGIDEHRRGRPRWRRDTDSGEYVQLADRWHTCFYDLSGSQGMPGQAEGRTADDAAYWLAGATQDWRDAVEIVAIDMCTIYLPAVRRMLPHAKVAVDLFHVAGSPSRRPVTCGAAPSGRSTAAAARPATPSTASSTCWNATWRTCPRTISRR